jgi:SAM-dependent methyltransferase
VPDVSRVRLDGVLPVLQDDRSLGVRDALKPSFSAEGIRRRAEMQRRLQHGELAEAQALLQRVELLEHRDGEWRIPACQIRLAYQLVGSQRGEAEPVAAVAQSADEGAGDRWLDIACGSGALLRTARRMLPCRTVGVDLDAQALALARQADRATGSLGSYACAPADQLPVADQSADVATSVVSLQHFHGRPAIRERGRVLPPGGALYLRLHGTGYYWELAAKCLRCLWHGLRVAAGLPEPGGAGRGVETRDSRFAPLALSRPGCSGDLRRTLPGAPVVRRSARLLRAAQTSLRLDVVRSRGASWI